MSPPREKCLNSALIWGPEKLYEKGKGDEHSESLVTEYVVDLMNRMKPCQELAIETKAKAPDNKKKWYDRDVIERKFWHAIKFWY